MLSPIFGVPRNRPDIALDVLRDLFLHGKLRDEDICVALKSQDDQSALAAQIRAAGLRVNDPGD